MGFRPGSKVGPFEIVASLGSGSMGDVYRARDRRLGRDVAVKILPTSLAADPDRLRRFAQEARATGSLNHPNILAIFDAGAHEDSSYIVSEFLEGETLRHRLNGGALSPRKAVDYAVQIARGLATAHEKGVIHRDLKPENIMLTRDGQVKILDFGLAKLLPPDRSPALGPDASTVEIGSRPGTVLGTVGYMSPEQVRGEEVDHRSDIFALGAILYEMLAGRRAFLGETAVATMNAVLKEEPPAIPHLKGDLSDELERIVRHCLEKNPADRFQSARDLAFDLEAAASLPVHGPREAATARARGRVRAVAVSSALAFASVVGAVAYFAGQRAGQRPAPSFRRLTFRRGDITAARFSTDGYTIVYSAAWESGPQEIYTVRLDTVESKPAGFSRALLVAARRGEMALLLLPPESTHLEYLQSGTLARVPLEGGPPREVREGVVVADYAADDSSFVVAHRQGGRCRLEHAGRVLYETAGRISSVRVSPKRDGVAFIDHVVTESRSGPVVYASFDGSARPLTQRWDDAEGLAWSPDGREVWFTAATMPEKQCLWAVSLAGKTRLVLRVPGELVLQDTFPDGRVLLKHALIRVESPGSTPETVTEHNLAWLDGSYPADLTPDGRNLLFAEAGEGGTARYSVCLRRTDGSPPLRLGEGGPVGLSPDGKWATSLQLATPTRLVLLPTGPGEPKELLRGSIAEFHPDGWWFPDNRRILFPGNESGRPIRLFVQAVSGGNPRPVTPEGVTTRTNTITADGRFVAGRVAPDDVYQLYPVDGGDPQLIPGIKPGEEPLRFSADGRYLFACEHARDLTANVFRLNLATGNREPWKQLKVADPAGVTRIRRILMTPDGRSYVYSYQRILSDLYLVEGLR